MKKFLVIFVMAICTMFASCNSCHRTSEPTYPVTGINVEEVNAADNEYMSANYGEYRWLESCIDMEDWLDEADTCIVKAVANIFSVVNEIDSTSFTTTVYLIAHTADTTVIEERYGIWVGDSPMNEFVPFNVNFANAYNRMMEANCVKPHSRHCVLRKEVAPIDMNPLYIFGNQDMQVYVNTNTGDVNTENPCFPDSDEEIETANNDDMLKSLGYAFTW